MFFRLFVLFCSVFLFSVLTKYANKEHVNLFTNLSYNYVPNLHQAGTWTDLDTFAVLNACQSCVEASLANMKMKNQGKVENPQV